MKTHHKVAGGAAAILTVLIGAAFEVWDRIESRHVAEENRRRWECDVRVCEARGGQWKGTECVGARRRR